MINKRKNEKGITLIALVLTVIIMIILAGITFNALVGDNGILGNAMSAKAKHEDEGAKEELQFAWSARMSKFYEAVASGQATNIVEYFSKADVRNDLNSMLGNGGKVNSISFKANDEEFGEIFEVTYMSSGKVSYKAKVKPSGEIVELKRIENNTQFTEVWANYFEKDGIASLIYTTSSLGNTYNGNSNWDEYQNWNITMPIYSYQDVPWDYDKTQRKYVYSTYAYKVKNVEISEDIVPESTQYMFYDLDFANFIGLDNLLKKVTEIGANMFSYCRALTNITIPNNVTSIGDYAFYSCSALTSITIPSGVTSIGEYTFCYCSALTSITIPENVNNLGKQCFYNCSNLKIVNYNAINASETNLFDGEYCYPIFLNCNNITEINIGSAVKLIPMYAFFKLNITSIQLPNGLEEIGNYVFYKCSSLTSVTIPNSVISIGDGAFDSCESLTSITIPENVKKLGGYCFAHCNNLDTIYYNAINASETNVFSEAGVPPPFSGSGLHLYIGSNVKALPDYVFRSMTNVESLTLPEGLESIGVFAFQNDKFTSIEIPSSVISIGDSAFYKCTNLATITIRKSNDGSLTGAPWGAPDTTTVIWEP